MAGTSQATPSIQVCKAGPTPEELAQDPLFKEFSYEFIARFKTYADFYGFAKMANKEEFLEELKACDGEIETAEKIYERYSIDFNGAMERKNAVDNILLKLFNDFPALQELEDEEAWKTISDAIDMVVDDPANEVYEQKVMPPGEGGLLANGVTVEEIWECLKKAVGVGAGSIISIGALKKLAAEGIQQVIATITRLLAKRAGWFGAALMITEFVICLRDAYYEEDPKDQ